jgi:hypothetical protein
MLTQRRSRSVDPVLTYSADVSLLQISPPTQFTVLPHGKSVREQICSKMGLGVSQVDIAVLLGQGCGI